MRLKNRGEKPIALAAFLVLLPPQRHERMASAFLLMKCPNCNNEIALGGFMDSLPVNDKAKWYQFTNIRYRGGGLKVEPRRKTAKWYQYSGTKVTCDACSAELEISESYLWLRFVGVFTMFSHLIFRPLLPDHLKTFNHLLLLSISMTVLGIFLVFISYRARSYSVRIKYDK